MVQLGLIVVILITAIYFTATQTATLANPAKQTTPLFSTSKRNKHANRSSFKHPTKMSSESTSTPQIQPSRDVIERYRPEFDNFLKTHPGKLKMLLLVRNDLGMTKGKMAAQASHAAMGIVTQYLMPKHEMLLVSPDRVDNPWEDDVMIWDDYDEDGEDEDEDDDNDEQDDADLQKAIALSLSDTTTSAETTCDDKNALQRAEDEKTQHSGEDEDEDDGYCNCAIPHVQKSTTTASRVFPESTPADAPQSTETTHEQDKSKKSPQQTAKQTKASPILPHTPCKVCKCPVKPDPNNPQTLYLRQTPREIRKMLYNIDMPIEILMKHIIAKWVWRGQAKIALRVDDKDQLDGLLVQLRNAGIPTYEIHDAGLTQIASGSLTCSAVGPFPADILDKILGKLKLL